MSQDTDTSTFGPDEDAAARAAAEALTSQRPTPPASFRGALAQRLSALDPGFGPRPANLWPRVLGLVVLGSVLLLFGVARAVAHSSQQRAQVTAGRGLTVGFSGAPELTYGSVDATTAQWVQKANAVGTQIVRITAYWSTIAPNKPPTKADAVNPNWSGYDWAPFDQQVEQLTVEGFRVMITINYAPRWAEAADPALNAYPGTWKPGATAFGQFATAITRRYDGETTPTDYGVTATNAFLPKVTLWQPWNEPNLNLEISPQWNHTAKGFTPASPGIYRSLLNAFYASAKAVSKSNYVIAAGTAPFGDPPGGYRMAPVTFDQYLDCLNTSDKKVACSDPPHFDAIDHHPYGIGGPEAHALNATDATVPDIYKLTRVLAVAERDHTALPAGKKGVWITEIAWNTTPPVAGNVPIQQAARWVEQAFYVLWHQGVSTVLWYRLADEPTEPNQAISTHSGIYFIGGSSKPLTISFRFPFLSNRRNKTTIVAWGRAPQAGQLSIEQQGKRGWTVLTHFTVRKLEVFQLPLRLKGKATLRAVLGANTSLSWSQGA
jgi:hypothetical protein